MTKVVLVTDCGTHMVLAAVPGRGPGSDLVQFKAALKDACEGVAERSAQAVLASEIATRFASGTPNCHSPASASPHAFSARKAILAGSIPHRTTWWRKKSLSA